VGEEVKTPVYTASVAKLQRIAGFRGRRAAELDFRPRAEFRASLPALEDEQVVYVDIHGLTEAERRKLVALVSANQSVRVGIIDPAGSVKDVAALFHAGVVDYIGKAIIASGIPPARRAAAADFAGDMESGDRVEAAPPAAPGPADGWADVRPGREHVFAFLLVEVDDAEELKKRHEPENLAAAMETFREFVFRIASQHAGRLWMWSRFGGLILFPLTADACQAALCGVRILLSSIFYDVEESLLPGRISFRMALSRGATVYHESDTGRIVSDAINSIFHLGRRFARDGQFLLTAESLDLVPPSLRALCQPAGTFEGRRILRMLRPSSSLGVREAGGAWDG
jgi:class 3 adenylate cyclase